jgi:hypothetical protein
MTVFWDVAPYSLVEINRRFRGAYCLYHQGDADSLLLLQLFTFISACNITENS